MHSVAKADRQAGVRGTVAMDLSGRSLSYLGRRRLSIYDGITNGEVNTGGGDSRAESSRSVLSVLLLLQLPPAYQSS